MKFESKALDDGSLQVTVTIDAATLQTIGHGTQPNIQPMSWGKTDYCVSCNNGKRYTIETYGDIAANIEAAATCFKESGSVSYGLSKGSCT